MSSFEETLIGMGFAEANVRYALNKTGAGSVQAALDYMINHPDADGVGNDDHAGAIQVDHAPAKVFSEEEKLEQKRMLEERIRAKREERARDEAREALAKEKTRREEGKMTTTEKLEHQRRETDKVLAIRKREKAEDAAAKKSIRQQLAADKARREGVKATPAPAKATAAKPAPAPKPTQDYGECAIRFRLADGQQLTGKFQPTDPLSVCFAWLDANRKDKPDPSMATELSDALTRKSYTLANAAGKTILDIGCVPRGVLMVKSHPRPKPVHRAAVPMDHGLDDDDGDYNDYDDDDSDDNY